MADSSDKKLEMLRLQSEHARVYGSRMDMLYKIAQDEAEIKRLNDNIAIQDKRLADLEEMMKKISSEA